MTSEDLLPDGSFSEYRSCRLCPRECGVDRISGEVGFCGESAACRVSSMGPHFGEEPSFSGRHGSGTVFFAGCSCGCFFCQNYQISREHLGDVVSPQGLLGRLESLVASGVHNVNVVTPSHFWPHVRWLCDCLRDRGMGLPVVYNSSGYERVEVIAEVAEKVPVFLPDFKFSSADLASRCMGDRRYPELALAAIERMVKRRGFLRPWDDTGRRTAEEGVLVRHLVLPGEIDNSLGVLRLLLEAFGPDIPMSVMSQFRPMPECFRRQDLDTPVPLVEYRAVIDEVERLGFTQVYIQPELGDEAFLPDFEADEPFEGNQRGSSGV